MYKKSFYTIFYLISMLIMFGCGSGHVLIDDKISKVEVFTTKDTNNVLVDFTSQRIRDPNTLDIIIGSLNISLLNSDNNSTQDIQNLKSFINKLSNLNIDFSKDSLLLYVQDEPIIKSYEEELIVRNPTMLDVPTAEIVFKYVGDSSEPTTIRYVLLYKISNKITEVKLNLFENEEVVIPW